MHDAATRQRSRRRSQWTDRWRRLPGLLTIVVFLFLVWNVFSSMRDLFHLALGLGTAIFVAALTHRLLLIETTQDARGRSVPRYVFSFPWHRLLIFVPWALWKIFTANLYTASLLLLPRRQIDPGIIEIRTGLQGDLARTALAMVITLTPGTCVLDIKDDLFVIHRIHPHASAGIASEMVPMVKKTFDRTLREAMARPKQEVTDA